MKINWRITRLVVIGAVLLAWPAVLDFWKIPFLIDHEETFGVLANVSNFVAVAFFFSVYFRERSSAKQEKIFTVAYRSLSQASNDVSRKLIAPLNGANLYELGLYKYENDQWEQDRARLERFNLQPPVYSGEALIDIQDQYFKDAIKVFMKDDEVRICIT